MKKVSVVLPYANPHVLDWVFKMKDVSLNIGCFKSTQVFRPGYFYEYDEIDEVNYFYKGKEYRNAFLNELKNADVLITLGIFDVNLLKLKKYCRKDIQLIVLSEPFNPINSSRKMLLRKAWGLVIRLFYKHIIFFCLGGISVKEYYCNLGFNESQFYNFGYFPDVIFSDVRMLESDSVVKIGFLGQLIERKGIDRLLGLMDLINGSEFNCQLQIAGDGELKNSVLEQLYRLNDNRIVYKGLIAKKESVEFFLEDIDILFVPSYFDGWGAVINEALSKCCMIIASDKVYAANSILGNKSSSIFQSDFKSIFYDVLGDIEKINNEKIRNKELFNIWNPVIAANDVENFINFNYNASHSNILKLL